MKCFLQRLFEREIFKLVAFPNDLFSANILACVEQDVHFTEYCAHYKFGNARKKIGHFYRIGNFSDQLFL